MTKKTKRRLGPEIAIVLGSGILDGGKPGPRTALRANAAAKLAMAHPKMTIIACGDGRNDRQRAACDRTEAWHIARILRQNGVSNRRILLEPESRDTRGNAVLAYARYLKGQKPRRVYIVTSGFHERRAMLTFSFVLGPGWELESYLCAVDPGDSARLETSLDETEQFFAGIAAGDFPAVVARLLEVGKPFYRSLDWLKEALKMAA
jgi:hypothetical protein